MHAADEVFGKHTIHKHLFFRLFDQDRADDALQEVYFRFWKYLESGRPIDHPKAFLYQIAKNHIVDLSRKRETESLEQGIENYSIDEPSITDEYDSDLFTDYNRGEIQAAIDKLPEHWQAVVYMRYFQDLGPEEIADLAGKT